MIQPTGYKYYIKLDDGGSLSETIDIEDFCKGMYIREVEGLRSLGKRKKVVTESYPEAQELRVFSPNLDVTFAPTKITIRAMFIGENRDMAYSLFSLIISSGTFTYWDNNRNIKVHLLFDDEIKIKEEKAYGNEPYFLVDFVFTNLSGTYQPA